MPFGKEPRRPAASRYNAVVRRRYRTVCFLTVLDLFAYWTFEVVNAYPFVDAETQSLLSVFGHIKPWIRSLVFPLCTFFMAIFLDPPSFDERPIVFWFLKDLVACNIIGFDTWYRSPASLSIRTNLRYFSQQGLYWSLSSFTKAFRLLGRAIYTARWVILVGLAIFILCAMLNEHARSNRVAAARLEAALNNHANTVNRAIKDHQYTVERVVENHSLVTEKAIRTHGKHIEAASINMATAINTHATTVGRAITYHRKATTQAIDNQAYVTTNAIRQQSRQIEAASVNVISSINQHDKQLRNALSHQTNELERVFAYNSQPNLLEPAPDARMQKHQRREAQLDVVNSGLSITQAVLGIVTPIVATGCTVM